MPNCSYCDFTAPTARALRTHREEVHLDRVNVKVNGVTVTVHKGNGWECPCGKRMTVPRSFVRHCQSCQGTTM